MVGLLFLDILTEIKINGRRLNKTYLKLKKFQADIPQ